MSTAKRVSRGFHRLGIFIAAVLFLNGLAIAVSLAVCGLVRAIRPSGPPFSRAMQCGRVTRFGVRWLLAIGSLLLLCGCALWSKSLPPYTLSDSETTTVERGILSATKDLDKPGFRGLKAAKSSNGDLYVCGWMDSNKKAYRSPEQAFIGTLSAGQFSPSGMGMNAESNAEVVAECKKLGISI